MKKHLQREVDSLKRNILMIGTAVETAIDQAFRALLDYDTALAEKVIADDEKIDEWELEVEEECLKLLALYRPAEADLRFIVGALKMNSDLERMGDLAANIASITNVLAGSPRIKLPAHLKEMVALVRRMVRKTIDALVRRDAKLGLEVTAEDSRIDRLHRKSFRVVEESVAADPSTIRGQLYALTISRHLERIADHATNIAEDIVYMIEGDIIRHHVGEYAGQEDE
jgi:phosphate transport system protein